MTKQELLNTDYFIDNEYLDQYLKLTKINSNAKYLERHHILPKAYYRLKNLKVDNTKNNIIKLSFANHCKAHWLLYFCTKDELKYANQTAFAIMMNGITKHIKDYTEADFIELQKLKDLLVCDSNSFWSQEDDLFLKNNFLRYTDNELALKLNRTEIAIRARRTTLGLQRFKMKDFTAEEIKYLKENYQVKSLKELSNALNRSVNSIAQKCNSIGLHKSKNRKWTEAEVEYIKENATKKSLTELSGYLGRSKLVIKQLCHRKHIKCKRTDLYSQYELEYIKNNYGKLTAKQMAKNINRSIMSIEHKIHELLTSTGSYKNS